MKGVDDGGEIFDLGVVGRLGPALLRSELEVGGEFGGGGVEEISDVPEGGFDLRHAVRVSKRSRMGKGESSAFGLWAA